MKNIFFISFLLFLMFVIGCSYAPVKVETEFKVAIPNININSPEGMEIEIFDADPVYVDRKETQETICSVSYNVRNSTKSSIRGGSYRIIIRGYASDGELIFERDSMLFVAEEIAPGTYTQGYVHTGFIGGVTKIDRLDVTVRKIFK